VAVDIQKRRRRTPEEAEREILDAAETFLRSRPFRDLTIDEVMDGTGLSRPSFYVYFRDRHHLALKLIEEIGSEVFATAADWLEGDGDDLEVLRVAIRGTAGVFEVHGPVLRAIADASTENAEVEGAYRGLVEGFVDASARRIERDVAAGRSSVADPRRTAAALVWMNERLLSELLGREPADDADAVAQALYSVWRAAIYS
jgi:TetR/AcrR family transcriptional regulator, ethionamide resistance regulator